MSFPTKKQQKEVDTSFFEPQVQTVGDDFFATDEKKNPVKSDLSVGANGQLKTSEATISPLPSADVSFGQYDVFNNPLNVKEKPIVSVAGVPVPLSADLQQNSIQPTVSSQANLAQDLQSRINTKTYTPEDVGAVAQSMKVSFPAANAYMEGNVGTGTVIHFNDIKAEKQGQLKNTVAKVNAELGLNDSYDDIFTTPELAGAYLEKIQNLYDAKANKESVSATLKSMKDNPSLFSQGAINVNQTESKSTLNSAQEIKNILSNDIIDQISNDDNLNTDEKVKKIYSIVDSRDKANVENAIGKRLTPLNYMINVATGGNTSKDIDLLNSRKAGIEYKVNLALNDKLRLNQATVKSIAEEYSDKIASGEISPEDEKAKNYYAKRIADAQSEVTRISNEVVPMATLLEKYPSLNMAAVTKTINDFNAIKSGNIADYGDAGYEGVDLPDHLSANGFDMNSQVVKDALSENKIKDYSIIGSPIRALTDVFVNTGKGILDFTPLRDEATILAEKKSSDLFPTTVQPGDEFQLTTKAKIGQNIGNTTGQLLGQGLLQWGTGGLGRLAGMTKVAAANAAFFTSGALVGYDSHLKESYDLPIDTDAGRVAYATVNSFFDGATEKIFPEAKIFKIPGLKDAAVQLGSKLSKGELTEKLTHELIGKAKNSVLNYVVKTGENIAKESVEEGLTAAANDITKVIVGDPNMNMEKAIQDVKNTVIQTAIGTSLIGGYGAHRDIRAERNVSATSTIYNSAVYSDVALDAINLGYEANLYDAYERDAKVAILETAKQSLAIMDKTEKIEGKQLTRPQKEVYVANLTAESVLKGQKEGMDEVGQKSIDTKIANLQNQRQQILKGEVNIDENGNITEPVIKPIPTEVATTNVQNTEATIPTSTESVSTNSTGTTATVLDENTVPDITVGEMVNQPGIYKGQKGSFSQDGQTVIFKVEGQNKEYELGNINEIKDSPISQFGIEHETSVVGVDDTGNIKVRDESYVNNFSDPLQAINRDANGNVVSVNLETADGKKRTFRGNIAEDVAYQIHLKEITKDNETATRFENFINTEPGAQEIINNASVSETTPQNTDTTNAEVQREKIIQQVDVSETEYNDFIDKNIATHERLNSIAEKVKNQQQLSEKENAIFVGKTSEINKIIADGSKNTTNPNDEITKLETERDNQIKEASKPELSLNFVEEKNIPKIETDATYQGEVIGKKKIANPELIARQNEIKERFSKLQELSNCLNG